MAFFRVSSGGTAQPYHFHITGYINVSESRAYLKCTYVDKNGQTQTVYSPGGYNTAIGIKIDENSDVTITAT